MNQPWRLSQLAERIREVLQEQFFRQQFWVIAEVANHQFYPQKGFHYFDLIESAGGSKSSLVAKLPAVAWKEGALRIRQFEQQTGQRFGESLQVLVAVSVDYHPVYGLKLTLLDIDANFTLGMLEQQKQATLETLLRQYPEFVWETPAGGVSSFNQELGLPAVIQRIAVVSSRSAAGLEDFLHTLETNAYGYHFEVHPFYAVVQGEANAETLASVIESVADRALEQERDFDAVVLIRGGGAATDLLIFDQLSVALAVASCPFPVLTGIGHQKNETLADKLAHRAFKTPTAVAEFILEQSIQFESRLLDARQQIMEQAVQLLQTHRRNLLELRSAIATRTRAGLQAEHESLAAWKMFLQQRAPVLLRERQQELGRWKSELARSTQLGLKHKNQELEQLLRLFRMASPQQIWKRGFALVRHNGQLVADGTALQPGDAISIYINGAQLDAEIQTKTEFNGDPFNV